MKKKIGPNKLTLNTETVRQLINGELEHAAGARGKLTRPKTACYSDCGSCGIACTVIGCTA